MEFTPEQKVLNDLFGNDITYIIPEYQRPYSWDCLGKSDKNNQINTIWQDLIDFYESQNKNIYFMGSMVVIGDGTDRVYQVVDGQQRLTTLTILLTAIKCFLNEVSINKNIQPDNQEGFIEFIKTSSDNVDKLIFNEKRNGLFTRAEKKVKIEKSFGFDYDIVLKTVMECGHISGISLKNASEEQKEVSLRYFKNREYFIEQLRMKFLDNHLFTYQKAEELGQFFDFLKNKVTVVQIRAPKFDVAYQIFEILNNRGLPLSNKDLFRNFLISEFYVLKSLNPTLYAALDPNEKWKALEANYNLDNEFISRYVESKLGKSQQYSAFNDLQKIYKEIKPVLGQIKVEVFYSDLEKYLAIYTQITNLDFEDKYVKSTVQFVLNAGNLGYSLNLLMALFFNINDTILIAKFLKTYENYTALMLLSASKRFSVKPIYKAINYLNANNYDAAIKEFDWTQEDKKGLKACLDGQIKDNDIAKLLIAKYLWTNEAEDPEDVVEQILNYDKATLEHIIPQTPSPNTNWTIDFSPQFRTEYTYKLGNMTLLTQKMNSANKNYDFAIKREKYKLTKLSMTKTIANINKIDALFIENRHKIIVSKLIEAFNL